MVALVFDFMNGFHDAANSIATVVSTGVLKPQQAVAFAAAFNVIAYFIFHLKVAATVGKGTIDPNIVDHYVIFGALVGAIGWNIITWHYGIPSSSSHALIGGLVGAALAKSGWGSLNIDGLLKTRLVHFHLAAARLRARLVLHAARVVDVFPHAAIARSTGVSGACNSCRRGFIASGTAATTRRKPSASSGCC